MKCDKGLRILADKLSPCAACVPPAKPRYRMKLITIVQGMRVLTTAFTDTKQRAQKHELSHCKRSAEVAADCLSQCETPINYFNVNVDGRKE